MLRNPRMVGTATLANVLVTALAIDAVADGASGLAANVTYTGEYTRIVDGGVARGGALLGNVDLDVSISLGEGVTAYLYVLGNHGEDPSALAGDAQGLSNITAPNAVRVYEAWLQGGLGNVDLKLGLYDLNSEFDTLEVASLFANSSFGVGPDLAQAGPMGPSIFPVTGLGLRARTGGDRGGYAQLALVDGQPGNPEDERATSLRVARHDGALLAFEAGYRGDPDTAAYHKVSVGWWRLTQRFDRIDGGRRQRGNQGAYASVEGELLALDAGALHGFARIGVADDGVNQFANYAGAGIVATDIVPGRPRDRLGVAVARVGFGHDARNAGALEAAELAVEATYELVLADWLTLQPNVQYIRNPGGDSALEAAWAVGSRAVVTWSY